MDENTVKLVPVTFLYEEDDGSILYASSDDAAEIAHIEEWVSRVFDAAPKCMTTKLVLRDIQDNIYERLAFLLDDDESRFVHVTPDCFDDEFSVCVGVFRVPQEVG